MQIHGQGSCNNNNKNDSNNIVAIAVATPIDMVIITRSLELMFTTFKKATTLMLVIMTMIVLDSYVRAMQGRNGG